MAQVSIREYDAKNLFAQFFQTQYPGKLIESQNDWDTFYPTPGETYVIKPDQLFGKRGKYGLVGVKLDVDGLKKWWGEHYEKEVEIGKQKGALDTFLIEPFVPHKEEYYVAISTDRTFDILYFSASGGIDVEENWDQVHSLAIPLYPLISEQEKREFIDTHFSQLEKRIRDFLADFYIFFTTYGFSYLEVNPFTFDGDERIVCLDMVARIDNTEAYKQKHHWENLVFVNPFGVSKSDREKYIEKLDSETGASLKLRILNPKGNIWLLTSGGGASVILADSIADKGLASEIGNYGECSGNPDRENTKAYTLTLLDSLLESPQKRQYLIIAGAIANFTHIDKTFAGIIDALAEKQEALKKKDLIILVRRGGINDIKGLQLMKDATDELGFHCEIAGGDVYMTDILSHIL